MILKSISFNNNDIRSYQDGISYLTFELSKNSNSNLILNAIENFSFNCSLANFRPQTQSLIIKGVNFITDNNSSYISEKIYQNVLNDNCNIRILEVKEKKKILGLFSDPNDLRVIFELHRE